MQSEIEKIEEELKKITEWPWSFDGNIFSVGHVSHHIRRDIEPNFKIDYSFIAASPERIVKLIEYVKAIEAFSPLKLVESLQAVSERLKIQFALVGDAEKELDRIREARKALGLE